MTYLNITYQTLNLRSDLISKETSSPQKYSEKMQQISRRTPIPKCDFNCWNLTLTWVSSFKRSSMYMHMWQTQILMYQSSSLSNRQIIRLIIHKYIFFAVRQLYLTMVVLCSRFGWITNSSNHRRVWTANLLHTG